MAWNSSPSSRRSYEALDTAFHAREIAAKAPLADAFVFLSGWYCSASAR